jgi:hypothetical protein
MVNTYVLKPSRFRYLHEITVKYVLHTGKYAVSTEYPGKVMTLKHYQYGDLSRSSSPRCLHEEFEIQPQPTRLPFSLSPLVLAIKFLEFPQILGVGIKCLGVSPILSVLYLVNVYG